MQKSAALGKTPPSYAKWGLKGHGSLAAAVHLLPKSVYMPDTPPWLSAASSALLGCW